MRSYLKYILSFLLVFSLISLQSAKASSSAVEGEEGKLDVGSLIMNHLADDYGWHITTIGETEVTIPLPVIVFGEKSGLNVFLSSRFEHGTAAYNGFYIAQAGEYKGKIVELNEAGEEIRPWDISVTRNVTGLLLASIVVISLILGVARWHKRQNKLDIYESPKGIVGFIEMFVMSVQDDIIKPCVGKNYKRFSPYLLTAFFFIFTTNLLGLIPGIVPGVGANVTGNIAVTVVLGLFTFFIVNVFGTREYFKEIFWPEVPIFLKLPVFPLMQVVELLGVFTKPFSLIIRLFANIFAGHTIMLGLTSLIFVAATMGAAILVPMTAISVGLSIFMSLLEILVAYIQAYVFTMLSAVFIGLAQAEPHHAKESK